MRSGVCSMVLICGALLVAGCSTPLNGTDPMLGEIHPPKPTTYGPTLPPKTSSNYNDPLLNGASGNVSLAPISDSRPPLAIGSTNCLPSDVRPVSHTNNLGIVPLARDGAAPGSISTSSYSTAPPTMEVLQQQLRARNVCWQQEPISVDGGIRFACYAPNRYNANSYTIYEATAPDLITAIQQVILKIDRP